MTPEFSLYIYLAVTYKFEVAGVWDIFVVVFCLFIFVFVFSFLFVQVFFFVFYFSHLTEKQFDLLKLN